MKSHSRLYLIPTPISPEDISHPRVKDILPQIEVFICERIRTTRRWLRTVIPDYDIDGRIFLEFDKHANRFPWSDISQYWDQGKTCGLTSEAGMPAVADPGYQVVAAAHKRDIPVVPLPGNNSIILSLMASGFDGNHFTFHGYFPIKEQELRQEINRVTSASRQGYAQIFIETPYRNLKTMDALLRFLPSDMHLSVSSGLGAVNGQSVTRSVKDWKKTNYQYLDKAPAVFILGQMRSG